jgi:hypothetical protein
LRAVKQEDDKQVEIAEQNPKKKERIVARSNLLLGARASSGVYYPQDGPMRTVQGGGPGTAGAAGRDLNERR